jgi:hypothetical protein
MKYFKECHIILGCEWLLFNSNRWLSQLYDGQRQVSYDHDDVCFVLDHQHA